MIAGVGLTSNGTLGTLGTTQGFFTGNGGERTGVLYSADGGASWTAFGGSALAGHSIVGVAAAAASCSRRPSSHGPTGPETRRKRIQGGCFDTHGGTTWAQVAPASGIPTDPTTCLIGDPTSSSRLYAAVTSTTDAAATALYVSNDTGAIWTPVFGAAQSGGVIGGDQTIIRAAANGSEIAVGVVDVVTGALTGLFLSTHWGSNWTSLAVPDVNPGGQGVINFAIAVDPTAPGVVYVTGDRVATYSSSEPWTVAAYRVTTSGAASMTGPGNTGSGSTRSRDFRAIAFDASGRLILARTAAFTRAPTRPARAATGAA